MKRVCAWCRSELEGGSSTSTDSITHGICDSCKRQMENQLNAPPQNFLDSFDEPILVVDSDARINCGNQAARDMLKKGRAELIAIHCGNAFNCVHSSLPEGCGKTPFCGACSVRRAVTETSRTGKSCFRVPAFVEEQTETGIQRLDLLVSTEKIGTMILLKIERPATASPPRHSGPS